MNRFNNKYEEFENNRQECYKMLRASEHLNSYLPDMTEEDFTEARDRQAEFWKLELEE